MSNAAVQRFYRYHACIYDPTRWMFLHGRRRAVECLALRADSLVLEIGCGTGLNFRYLFDRLDAHTGHVAGVDFSEKMLQRARKRVRACGWPGVELIQADATTLTLPHRFDAVLFAYSLAMIPDWRAAIDRACHHLKAGGRLVVLDFGTFEGWGPIGHLARRWLQWNHMDPREPHLEALRNVFHDLEVYHRLGGCYFIAVGRKTK